MRLYAKLALHAMQVIWIVDREPSASALARPPVLLPDPGVVLDVATVAKPGDAILRAGFERPPHAVLDAPVSAAIDKFSIAYPPRPY